jgi:hypothetical protein
MNREERIAANAKNDMIRPAEGFTKSQPVGLDTDAILELGDVLVFPKEMPEVYHQSFGNRVVNGETVENYGEFVVIEVINKDGESRFINFFPSSLTKNIWPAAKNAEGKVETDTSHGPFNPKGSAVKLYQSVKGKVGENGETDMQLGFELLLGKKVEITDKVEIDVQRWRNGQTVDDIRKTSLYTYDLQEAA